MLVSFQFDLVDLVVDDVDVDDDDDDDVHRLACAHHYGFVSHPSAHRQPFLRLVYAPAKTIKEEKNRQKMESVTIVNRIRLLSV